MKLTKKDKEYLLSIGELEEDFRQIEMACGKTVFTLYKNRHKDGLENSEKITQKKAIELLGRETFLNGISRSAFHYTSVREVNDNDFIHFDSSKLFK